MGRLTTADLRFVISYNYQDPQSKRLLAARLHFWRGGSEMRLETHSYSVRFYKKWDKNVNSKVRGRRKEQYHSFNTDGQ